jgi:hypothetical protein
MIFGKELIEKVLSGEKIVTRRRSSRYQVGKVYAIQPGRGKKHVGHIEILSVQEQRLSMVMRPGEVRREGFRRYGDFVNYWEKLHGPIQYHETVARIEFRLARSCKECVELGGRE